LILSLDNKNELINTSNVLIEESKWQKKI
jgi:hypothetical protein